MWRKLVWPIVIIISSMLAALAGLSINSGPVRAALIFWFILICPGMAFVRLIRPGDLLSEIMLSIGASLVVSTLIAGIQLITHQWSPLMELGILIAVSLLGASLQIRNVLQSRAILDGTL